MDGHKSSLPIIESLRNEKDKDKKNAIKRKLPVILFSGIFSKREDSALTQHSGIICIDLDNVPVVEYKNKLSFDPYTLACFVSPTGTGLKVLMKISNPERHREHYRAICKYYKDTYNIDADPTSINVSRACFISYDPELILNEESAVYGGFISERPKEDASVSQPNINTDYETLNIACKMIRKASDGDKHNVLLRASILCGGYIASGNMEEDEVVRVLSRGLYFSRWGHTRLLTRFPLPPYQSPCLHRATSGIQIHIPKQSYPESQSLHPQSLPPCGAASSFRQTPANDHRASAPAGTQSKRQRLVRYSPTSYP